MSKKQIKENLRRMLVVSQVFKLKNTGEYLRFYKVIK